MERLRKENEELRAKQDDMNVEKWKEILGHMSAKVDALETKMSSYFGGRIATIKSEVDLQELRKSEQQRLNEELRGQRDRARLHAIVERGRRMAYARACGDKSYDENDQASHSEDSNAVGETSEEDLEESADEELVKDEEEELAETPEDT